MFSSNTGNVTISPAARNWEAISNILILMMQVLLLISSYHYPEIRNLHEIWCMNFKKYIVCWCMHQCLVIELF